MASRHSNLAAERSGSNEYPFTSKSSKKENCARGTSGFKKRHILSVKAISFFLTFIFLYQQIIWAGNGPSAWPCPENGSSSRVVINGSPIELPRDAGQIEHTETSGGERTVIHIQDSHASLSAQYSIARLLDSLVTSYDLDLIAIEGASGMVDTSFLKTFPDTSIRNETAAELMKEGRMSAGEFFAITHDRDEVELFGIEDRDLYLANLEELRNVVEARDRCLKSIESLEKHIEMLSEKVYSEELLTVVRNGRLHRDGEMSFGDYWRSIRDIEARPRVSPGSYPELSKLIESVRLEATIDFSKANSQRKALINELSREIEEEELKVLLIKTLAFSENKISQADFHDFLLGLAEAQAIKADAYRDLVRFAEYAGLYESVNIFRLYDEAERFDDEVKELFFRNDEERELYEVSRTVYLMRKLYSMELSRKEHISLIEKMERTDSDVFLSFFRSMSEKHGIPLRIMREIHDVFRNLPDAMRFYDTAERRNRAMIDRTLSRMKNNGKRVAVLITGGFHTSGLTELMKENRLSYLVVMPKAQEGKERPYIAVLTNKAGPYREILGSGRYSLPVEALFQDKLNGSEQLALAGELCTRIFETLRKREVRDICGRWIVRYRDRYNELVGIYGMGVMSGKMSPAVFENFMIGQMEKHAPARKSRQRREHSMTSPGRPTELWVSDEFKDDMARMIAARKAEPTPANVRLQLKRVLNADMPGDEEQDSEFGGFLESVIFRAKLLYVAEKFREITDAIKAGVTADNFARIKKEISSFHSDINLMLPGAPSDSNDKINAVVAEAQKVERMFQVTWEYRWRRTDGIRSEMEKAAKEKSTDIAHKIDVYQKIFQSRSDAELYALYLSILSSHFEGSYALEDLSEEEKARSARNLDLYNNSVDGYVRCLGVYVLEGPEYESVLEKAFFDTYVLREVSRWPRERFDAAKTILGSQKELEDIYRALHKVDTESAGLVQRLEIILSGKIAPFIEDENRQSLLLLARKGIPAVKIEAPEDMDVLEMKSEDIRNAADWLIYLLVQGHTGIISELLESGKRPGELTAILTEMNGRRLWEMYGQYSQALKERNIEREFLAAGFLPFSRSHGEILECKKMLEQWSLEKEQEQPGKSPEEFSGGLSGSMFSFGMFWFLSGGSVLVAAGMIVLVLVFWNRYVSNICDRCGISVDYVPHSKWIFRLWRKIANIGRVAGIPLSQSTHFAKNWRKINELKETSAFEDPENFSVAFAGERDVIIATRDRDGIDERVLSIVAGFAAGSKMKCKMRYNFSLRHVEPAREGARGEDLHREYSMRIYSFRFNENIDSEKFKFHLASRDRNYAGQATIPSYTTSGIMTKLISEGFSIKEYPQMKPLHGDHLKKRITDAMAKVRRGVREIEQGARLKFALSTLDDMSARTDDMIGELDNGNITVKEFKLRLMDHVRSRLDQSLDNIRQQQEHIKDDGGNYDFAVGMIGNNETLVECFSQFWFWVHYPDEDYWERTTSLKTVSAADEELPDDVPRVIFADDMTPLYLKYLKDKYPVNAIVTAQGGATSHWVVYAKNLGISVISVDVPRPEEFEKKIEDWIDKMASMLPPPDERDVSNTMSRFAIVRSGNTGSGEVILSPSLASVKSMLDATIREKSFNNYVAQNASKPGIKGGMGIELDFLANADTLEEAAALKEGRIGGSAEFTKGVGLFRTEYLFSDTNIFEPEKKDTIRNVPVEEFVSDLVDNRDSARSRAHLKRHLKSYFKDLSDAVAGEEVTIRTLDLQPDKITVIHNILRDKGIPEVSGIDFYGTDLGREILVLLMEAVLEAYLDGADNLKILIPMVRGTEDVARIIGTRDIEKIDKGEDTSVFAQAVRIALSQEKDITRKAVVGGLSFGVMLENNEAMENLSDLMGSAVVDFYSVGTNDLARYVMTKELGREELMSRDSPEDRPYLTRLQPPVLKAIVDIIQEARGTGKELVICGEMASWYGFHVFLAYKLSTMGVRPGEISLKLSMAPYSVPFAKVFLGQLTPEDYEGIGTFLIDQKDSLGVFTAEDKARKVINKVFERIYKSEDFKTSNRQTYDLLKSEVEKFFKQGNNFVPGENFTVFQLTGFAEGRKQLFRVGLVEEYHNEKVEEVFTEPVQGEAEAVSPKITVSLAKPSEYRAFYRVASPLGLHASPCTSIAELVNKYPEVELQMGSQHAELKKIAMTFDLFLLVAKPGAELSIFVTGPEAQARSFVEEFQSLTDPVSPGNPDIFEIVDGSEEWLFDGSGDPADELLPSLYEVVLGIPDGIMVRMGEAKIEEMEKRHGIRVIRVSGSSGDMLDRLKSYKPDPESGYGASIAALLDVGRDVGLDSIEEIVGDFVAMARKDIMALADTAERGTHPGASGLTEEILLKIKDVNELRGIAAVLTRVLPDISSYELSEKGIYDMRVNSIHDRYHEAYLEKERGYVASLRDEKRKMYHVSTAENAGDLRLLASAISRRRDDMGIDSPDKDPVREIVIVKNSDMAVSPGTYLDLSGLSGCISGDSLVFMEDSEPPLTPGRLLEMIERITGEDVAADQVAIGDKSGILDVDSPGSREMLRSENKDSMLVVKMENGLISQLYRMTWRIMSNNARQPEGLEGLVKVMVEGYNLFVYLPEADIIDIQEIREYENNIQKVLVAA
jgi:phosphoenolpyruvate-protein kinase (PTS system EI component)/phosphotransferase system HPr-like phosphotransfer protein